MPLVLENCDLRWKYTETACGFEEYVRRRLSCKSETVEINAVDPRIEERRHASGAQDFCAIATR
jgi:hypothetical protein